MPVFATSDVDEVVDIFADAFAGYPVMRFTVGDEGDIAARERRLVRLFVERRVARGGPMYAVSNVENSTGKSFLGAILLTTPNEPESPRVAEISAAAWRELGDDARLRYDQYAAASNFFSGYPPHLHLNMIGVRRSIKGSGAGRVLLDKVRELAEAEPGWSGVSLTTENPRNVELYKHFGYEVIGEGEFAPGMPTWGMYLRLR
jgi:ribosomal protein S18 acetylase RimI-like enzyme